jgi:hypothetical protein
MLDRSTRQETLAVWGGLGTAFKAVKAVKASKPGKTDKQARQAGKTSLREQGLYTASIYLALYEGHTFQRGKLEICWSLLVIAVSSQSIQQVLWSIISVRRTCTITFCLLVSGLPNKLEAILISLIPLSSPATAVLVRLLQ